MEGTGKSEAWISIAAAAQQSNSDATFYVLDTDGSAEVSLLAHPKLHNVAIYQASDPDGLLITPDGDIECGSWWEAFAEGAKRIRALKPGREDWIIIDRLDRMWDAVQSYWIEKAYGEDENAYWTDLRAEQLKRQEEEGKGTDRDYGGFNANRDWVQIKKIYHSGVLGLLAGPPSHKLAVCLEKDIHPQSKKATQLRGLYGETMPAGRADQGADFWLTVHLKRTPNGEHLVFVRRTKDSSFENPGAVDVTEVGFAEGFLKPVWGWE